MCRDSRAVCRAKGIFSAEVWRADHLRKLSAPRIRPWCPARGLARHPPLQSHGISAPHRLSATQNRSLQDTSGAATHSSGLVFGRPTPRSPSCHLPRFFRSSIRSKRFRTLRFSLIFTADFKLVCIVINKFSIFRTASSKLNTAQLKIG